MRVTRKQIENMDSKEFGKFVVKHIVPVNKPRKSGVYMQFPFDLRASFDDKINYAAQGTRWTAFLNNAGTLAHVMCPEADILIRIKFNYPINTLTAPRQKKVIMARIESFVRV